SVVGTYDHGDHLLTMRVVRHAYNRHLFDPGMAHQYFLDFARVDVVPTAQDHVFLAIDDGDESVGIFRAEIARTEPALDDRRARCLGVVEIPFEDAMSADHDLA